MLPLNEFHDDQTFVSEELSLLKHLTGFGKTSVGLCLCYYAKGEIPKYIQKRNKTKSGEIFGKHSKFVYI